MTKAEPAPSSNKRKTMRNIITGLLLSLRGTVGLVRNALYWKQE